MPVAMGSFRDSFPKFFCAPQILLYPENSFSNKCCNKNKNISPLPVYFSLKTWLQACFMPAYAFKLVAF